MSDRCWRGLLGSVLLMLSLAAPSPSRAQAVHPTFWMDGFLVHVDLGPVRPGARPFDSPQWPSPDSARTLSGRTYTGTGRILIHGRPASVSFRGVKLAIDSRLHALRATSGSVSGTAGPQIDYSLGSVRVRIAPTSIHLGPQGGKAEVRLTVPLAAVAADPAAALVLTSTQVPITQDGSIRADFAGTGRFDLRRTAYRLAISPQEKQSVHLEVGADFAVRPVQKLTLRGAAARDGVKYSFQGVLPATGQRAWFTLTLLERLNRRPEEGYDLLVKSGSVTYEYASGGLRDCHGVFVADLVLPDSAHGEQGGRIKLSDIRLRTDSTGALFNRVLVPARLRTGFRTPDQLADAIMLIEPGAADSAWAYFPAWHSPQRHWSYPERVAGKGVPLEEQCATLIQFLDPPEEDSSAVLHGLDKRPGLTLLSGILHLLAPQVDATSVPPRYAHWITTPFRGGLTITPWGLTGELTGAGNSFILRGTDIRESSRPVARRDPTWQDILDAGGTRPSDPPERFQLARLRILEMRLDRMVLCKNQLRESRFQSVVHFPFPSFIDLEFEDTTLDSRGLFHRASGPIAPWSWTSVSAPPSTMLGLLQSRNRGSAPGSQGAILPLAYKKPPNAPKSPVESAPVSQILWAWRLPVTFADRGVTIEYPPRDEPATITALMDRTRHNERGEILSSEIQVPPLYSDSSAYRVGVRFAGVFTPRGEFRLTDWDQAPFFGRYFSKSFQCSLRAAPDSGLYLVRPDSDPVSRDVDFGWHGSIRFPFFGWRDLPSGFVVRNLAPRQFRPLEPLAQKGAFAASCGDAGDSLSVEVENLEYSTAVGAFTSDVVRATEAAGGVSRDLRPISIAMTSFTRGLLRTSQESETLVVIRPYFDVAGSCGSRKQIQQSLADAVLNSSFKDLVCYDTTALAVRGDPGSCCAEYFLGTYLVTTRADASTSPDTILSIPNTMYYPHSNPIRLDTQASSMTLSSDGVEEPFNTVIDLPGAQFAYTDDGAIVGSLSGRLPIVGTSKNFDGEFRFFLDTQCGYFYLQSAGTFTYFATFSGQVFIVHAPYEALTAPSPFAGTPPILRFLRDRALFPTDGDFTSATGLDALAPTTVITGVLISGNVSASVGVGPLTVGLWQGGGSYVFQFKDPGDRTAYRVGLFGIAQAKADLYVVSATGNIAYSAAVHAPESVHDLGSFFGDSEFLLNGYLTLTGCADARFGHCEGCVRCTAEYSNKTGFKFNDGDEAGLTVRGHCDWGGCSGCD